MGSRGEYQSPLITYSVAAWILSTSGATALWLVLSWHLWVSWLVMINMVTFSFFGFDKWRAIRGGFRIPEKVLHGLVFAGGSMGGLGAMLLLHHKVRKRNFQLIFWGIVALQIIIGVLGIVLSQDV